MRLDDLSENFSIVSVVNADYACLFPLWYRTLRRFTLRPIQVLVVDEHIISELSKVVQQGDAVEFISVMPPDLPFSSRPDLAAAQKLCVFDYSHYDCVLYMDIDTLTLADFGPELARALAKGNWNALIACLDFFVGYKEKLAEEMKILNEAYQMKFLADGNCLYVNTGLFCARKSLHDRFFKSVIETWKTFVQVGNKLPS